MTAPLLVFGYGNPSRGDDALGPLLVEALRQQVESGELRDLDLLTDFQLQVEHALDLRERRQVLFVDAAESGPEPFALTPLVPQADFGYTSHAMSAAAVLGVFEQIEGRPAPPASLLAIRGYAFNLGEPLSTQAQSNLDAAIQRSLQHLRDLASIPRRLG